MQIGTSSFILQPRHQGRPATSSIAMAHTFHSFPHLPTELRLKVWKNAFNSLPPRTIEITSQAPSLDTPVQFRKWIAMASNILTLLQVNREARYELLPRYSAPFNSQILSTHSPTSLLVNFDIDIIYFRASVASPMPRDRLFQTIFGAAEGEVTRSLKRLAGNATFWQYMVPANYGNSSPFREFDGFAKLEEIIIVPTQEQRLDDPFGMPKLARLEECAPRGFYEERQLAWFKYEFNSTPQVTLRSIKDCKEIAE